MGSTIDGTVVHLGHAFKIIMGLNTNPNLQLPVLILYLSKSMNQTAQFAESLNISSKNGLIFLLRFWAFGLVSAFR